MIHEVILCETHFIKQKFQVCLVCTIRISLLDFGKIELSPKMKDFIAYQMSEDNWKEICREYLENESEDRIKNENSNSEYDQAYTVIRLLVKKQIVRSWSDMEQVLNKFNKEIVKKFIQKFKKPPAQGQLYKPLLHVSFP